MNWPFLNLVHFKEFFQKKSDNPKFVGAGTEYANRSDNFPRFHRLQILDGPTFLEKLLEMNQIKKRPVHQKQRVF